MENTTFSRYNCFILNVVLNKCTTGIYHEDLFQLSIQAMVESSAPRNFTRRQMNPKPQIHLVIFT